METALYIFGGTVIVTLIGWIVVTRNSHLLAIQRDKNNREIAAAGAKDGHKREFRATILAVRDGFAPSATPGTKLVEMHQASIPSVRDACAAVFDDITDKAGFQRTRDAYLSLTRDQIENPDWSKKVKLAAVPLRCEIGRDRLRQLLEQLIGYTK